jgi:O-acetyl-ADP-ribose deacetylase (regulator of RNase III)
MAPQLDVSTTGITKQKVDAITNAANSHLQNWGGVAKVISVAGGPELEKECAARAPVKVGEAVETTAGDMLPLPRWVIHAATMANPGETITDGGVIDKATRSTLALADKLGAQSLALVAFGTGVGGFPLDKAAQIMVSAVRDYTGDSLQRIVFSVQGADAEKAFTAALAAH